MFLCIISYLQKRQNFVNMKLYSKIVISLLVLSLIWLYLILNLAYYTFFQEVYFFMPKINITLQFNIVYILGIIISLGYLSLIFLYSKYNN